MKQQTPITKETCTEPEGQSLWAKKVENHICDTQKEA